MAAQTAPTHQLGQIMQYCAFLAYRVLSEQHASVDWDKPTGGILMPIQETKYVFDVLAQRYHCGPHEQLIIHEVIEPDRVLLAERLQIEWNREMDDFLQWMRGKRDAA